MCGRSFLRLRVDHDPLLDPVLIGQQAVGRVVLEDVPHVLDRLAAHDERIRSARDDRDDCLDRPDVQTSIAISRSAQDDVKAARRDFLPQLHLWATAGVFGAEHPEAALPGGTSHRWQDDYAVGVRLSFPVFDGGFRRARLVQARAAASAAESLLRKRRLAALQELESARADLHSSTIQVAANREAVAEAREALRIETLTYETGKGAMNDVLNAEAVLLNAKALLREALRLVEVARLAEALALGTIDRETVHSS